ncbi:MAG: ion transporter [Chloroflexi bacterium]|nr:ion transporter [Chloroflexota bacterium]
MDRRELRAAHAAADRRGDHTRSIRDRYNQFIARHATLWEITFAVVALVYVALAFVQPEHVPPETIATAELSLTVILAVEFFTRLWAAHDRASHLRRHFIDLIALAPPVHVLRALRLFRLLRVFAGFYRAGMEFRPLARHRGFLSLMAVWLGVGIVCSLAFFVAEFEAAESLVDDPIDAVWWGIGSLTQVGSDVFPVTIEGRVAAVVLMIVSVLLFSAITATITSVLIDDDDGGRGPSGTDLAGEIDRLANLRDRGALTDDEFAEAKRLAFRSAERQLHGEGADAPAHH